MPFGRSVEMGDGPQKFMGLGYETLNDMGSIRQTLEIPADFADDGAHDDDLDDDVMILGTTPQFGSTPRHPNSVLGGEAGPSAGTCDQTGATWGTKVPLAGRRTRMATRMGVQAVAVMVQEEEEHDDEYDESSDDDSCMLGMSPDVADGFSQFGAQHAEVSARR